MGQESRYSVTYDAPPLVEVAISIQFDPPKGLNQAHLGAFWVTQKDLLPNVRAVQPIATTNENFGSQGQWLPPSLQLALTNEPDCRTSDDLAGRSMDVPVAKKPTCNQLEKAKRRLSSFPFNLGTLS